MFTFWTNFWRISSIFLQVWFQYALASGTNSTTNKKDATFFTQDMITGLCAGFGFIVALLALICLVWCLCCGNGCSCNCCKNSDTKKRRVGPSPPPSKSRPGTRATTAQTTSTRITNTRGSRRS